jgi:hypothetical protein
LQNAGDFDAARADARIVRSPPAGFAQLGSLMSEGRHRHGAPLTVEAPAPSTPDDALTRLRLLYDRIAELLGWLSPAVAAKHTACDMHMRCLNLLRPEVLLNYQHALPPAQIDLAALANLHILRKALRYAERRKQTVLIKDGHRLIGHLTCAVP